MTVTFTLGLWLIMPIAWTSACLFALIKEDDSDATWPIIFVWAAALAMNKERKQRLMVLIEGKENEQLGAKPLEELRAILATL